MSASAGPILPVINIPVNYDEEREKIQDFLEHFKAPSTEVPSLSRVGTVSSTDPLALPPDQLYSREEEAEHEESRRMHVDGEETSQEGVVNKYLVQLVRMIFAYTVATHCKSRSRNAGH